MPRSTASSGLTSDSFVPLSRQSSGLRRTTTRPTTTATSIATQDIICAVSESRGISSTVGLAFVNLSTAETVLCQICDSQTYVKTITKIGVFEPTEILFMNTAKESKLFYIIKENIPNTTLTFLDRKSWSDKSGLELAERLAFPVDIESIKITFGGNYFAACCFAAVIQYVELELNRTFMAHSLRIRFEPSHGTMSIDLPTIFSLELIQNLHVRRSKESLYGLLNETLTPMGARLLRANLLQPSTEESKLLARYDAVEDLSTKEEMFASIRQALKGFVDVDKVLTSLILVPTKQTFQYLEQSVNNVIMLKSCVSSIKPLFKALGPAQSSLLLTIRELCAPAEHRDIERMIDDTINDHITYQTKPLDLRNQRIYCIKAGVNTMLDVARQTYKEASIDAVELVAQLSETHSLDLDLKFDRARQYYMTFQAADIESLPEVFINVYRKKNRIECQTLGLLKLNQKILDAHNEVVNLSDDTIQDLIKDVCAEISKLFRASEAIAMLDMLAAFAQLASCNDYIRPELTDTLAIKDGRHPIREKIHAKKFIPNDAYATQQSRFQIITGCNMSGKSTYIRTLALMAVMAQAGCFIPAEYASFRIIHELFARVSTSDDLEANVSTFAAEMREMSFILRNLSPRSMVIVDELGRGTSTTDGLCIAVAIAEALIQSNAFVWFVTHFQDLATILAERSGVISLHLAAEISLDASKMTMLYKIVEGPNTSQFYGLALAKLVDLPPVVLQTAQRVSEHLNQVSERRHGRSRALTVVRKRSLLLSLREQLLQARNGNLKGNRLREWLKRLQDDFALRMAAIDEEHNVLIEEADGLAVRNADATDEDENNNSHGYHDEEESELGITDTSQLMMVGSPFEYSDDGLPPSDSVQVFNDASTDEMLMFATSSPDGQVVGVDISSDVFS